MPIKIDQINKRLKDFQSLQESLFHDKKFFIHQDVLPKFHGDGDDIDDIWIDEAAEIPEHIFETIKVSPSFNNTTDLNGNVHKVCVGIDLASHTHDSYEDEVKYSKERYYKHLKDTHVNNYEIDGGYLYQENFEREYLGIWESERDVDRRRNLEYTMQKFFDHDEFLGDIESQNHWKEFQGWWQSNCYSLENVKSTYKFLLGRGLV